MYVTSTSLNYLSLCNYLTPSDFENIANSYVCLIIISPAFHSILFSPLLYIFRLYYLIFPVSVYHLNEIRPCCCIVKCLVSIRNLITRLGISPCINCAPIDLSSSDALLHRYILRLRMEYQFSSSNLYFR